MGHRNNETALEIVAKYYHAKRIPAKTRYFVHEVCDELFSKTQSLAEIADRILRGSSAGYEVKDFLHEFRVAGSSRMLAKIDEDPPS